MRSTVGEGSDFGITSLTAAIATWFFTSEHGSLEDTICASSLIPIQATFSGDINNLSVLTASLWVLAVKFRTQGISSSPIPPCSRSAEKRHAPLTTQLIVPPCLINIEHIADIFLGTCPTVVVPSTPAIFPLTAMYHEDSQSLVGTIDSLLD